MGKTKGIVDNDPKVGSPMDDLPFKFFQFFVMTALRIDLLQPGRVLCSLKVPARLLVCFFSLLLLAFSSPSIHFLMRFLLPFSICLLISSVYCLIKNDNNSMRQGASALLVDCLGHAAVKTLTPSSTGVSLEVNVSFFDAAYLDEEIEIDSNVLRMGKTIAVVNVEFRKKSNGKIIAQGRLTTYVPVSSKL